MNEAIFSFANSLALLSWITLIVFPYKKWTSQYLFAIPITLLSLSYLALAFWAFDGEGGFSSLGEVMTLFENEKAVLVGWIHYLAFDLMVGLYIVNNAMKHQINRFVIVPALGFTFMLGPIGLILYQLIRIFKTRSLSFKYE